MRDPDTVYAYQAPWQSNDERLVSEALEYAAVGSPRPPQQNPAGMIPPRFGYATEQPTIEDILSGSMTRLDMSHVNDFMPTDFSGTAGGYEGSPRNQAGPW